MFNFIGRLFGSEKALTKVVESVSNGLDALVYTNQEQAEDQAQAVTEARGMIVKWMNATQGQNLARRLIALSITGVWLLQYLIAQVCNIIAIWAMSATPWNEAAVVMRSGADDMGSAVMLILSFYFAAPYMGSVVDGVMSKFSKTNK